MNRKQTESISLAARLLPFIIIVAAVLAFFNKLVFSNLILARGDTFLYFYPYWHVAAEALKAAHLPLWNDMLFMGSPFLANSQAGVLYPLNWPFWLALSTPDAVTGSVILHLAIAGWGAYLTARRCLKLSRLPAFTAAVLFALGGYLTAQVAHVNQLQGLAWLPWYFVAACRWQQAPAERRRTLRFIAIAAVLMSLQLLAGHTQSLFISVLGVLIWVVLTSYEDARWNLRRSLIGIIFLSAAGVIALMAAGQQVVPTIELLMQSSRQGGFTPKDALAFSLHPLILTRALLPQYSGELFSEYSAFLPISALLLATVGAWRWRSDRQIRALLILALVGFLFALGLFNPLYQLLVRLPGFDLFRAPARWLALYGFSAAMLAGAGFEALLKRENERDLTRAFIAGGLLIGALLLWGILSIYLANFLPVGDEISVESPSLWTWVFWVLEIAIVFGVLFLIPLSKNRITNGVILALLLVVLFISSRTLPYNRPTTPEAFSDYRTPSTRINADNPCGGTEKSCAIPPGRVLSLSDIFFDPGDQAEINSVYQGLLSEEALYDYTIAIKQKEIIAPDLSMLYGIQSVDGFDGGLLPLADYIELMSLLLPEGTTAVDGRLREYLSDFPDEKWLDLFNVQYLITDKVSDEWREGVFFDRQHSLVLNSSNPTSGVGYIPDFMSTEVWLIADGDQGLVDLVFEDGSHIRKHPELIGDDLYRVVWSVPAQLASISFFACETAVEEPESCLREWRIDGISLVDGQEEAFLPIVSGNYRLLHSGDVKIYENLDVMPRAFLVNHWLEASDTASSIEMMAAADFNPGETAVVIGLEDGGSQGASSGTVDFASYEPERVRLSTASESAGMLVLTDAHYPGWIATVDGQPAEIYQANGYFRGILVPPGNHTVEFHFEPSTLPTGLVLSSLGIFVVVVLLVIGFRKREVE